MQPLFPNNSALKLNSVRFTLLIKGHYLQLQIVSCQGFFIYHLRLSIEFSQMISEYFQVSVGSLVSG